MLEALLESLNARANPNFVVGEKTLHERFSFLLLTRSNSHRLCFGFAKRSGILRITKDMISLQIECN
jgi:hypothetical protein